jgi:putative oxygen-independent coproporphyrinogen III oxidase
LSAFGLYIHWPFCKAKCPYCDFNSHVRHQPVDTMGFAESLVAEMKFIREMTGAREVTSVFFGGGTPSLMPPKAVEHVLDEAAKLWSFAPDVEITLEANPTSVEAENFRGYRAAGVNRVSVGVQSLDEADLKSLGRQHTPEEALQAFRLAAKIFPRVSFDMIYARPNQSLAQWRAELGRALTEQQGHMSLYQLTIEPETRYADLFAAGTLKIPGDDLAADLYDLTQEMTAEAGLGAYEVSNHASDGHECQHNLLYWRYGEYAGIGPGAHGRLRAGENNIATICEKHPETWRQWVATQGHGLITQETVTPTEQAREYMLMCLRIAEGMERPRYEALAGQQMSQAKLDSLADLGLLREAGDRIQATQAGRRVLNALIAELVD